MAFEQTYSADLVAAQASEEARSSFIRRTYLHLAGAIGLFAGIEAILLGPLLPKTMPLIIKMVTGYNWLIVLGLFMAVGWLADWWARQDTSPALQYVGLGLYVLVEAIIFLPLLLIATHYADPSVLPTAAIMTLGLFGGLTAVVFVTRKDFSFMRTALMVGGFLALGLIVCGMVFGFHLGLLFSGAMVVLAGGYILYYTSNVLHHYRTDQHVAAALALFAAVALLFYYILMLLLEFSRD